MWVCLNKSLFTETGGMPMAVGTYTATIHESMSAHI